MFEMGKYGAFVWSCYGLVLLGLIWFLANSLQSAKMIQNKIKENSK